MLRAHAPSASRLRPCSDVAWRERAPTEGVRCAVPRGSHFAAPFKPPTRPSCGTRAYLPDSRAGARERLCSATAALLAGIGYLVRYPARYLARLSGALSADAIRRRYPARYPASLPQPRVRGALCAPRSRTVRLSPAPLLRCGVARARADGGRAVCSCSRQRAHFAAARFGSACWRRQTVPGRGALARGDVVRAKRLAGAAWSRIG